MNTDLITHTKASEMAAVYKKNTTEIVNHLREITRLRGEICNVFFGVGSFQFDGCSWNDDELTKLQRQFKRDAWRELVDKLEIRKYMCSSDQDALDATLRHSSNTYSHGKQATGDSIDEWPEIEPDSITSVLQGYMNTAPEFLDKSVREEWRYWIPKRDSYVTNQDRWKVSAKVIMSHVMRPWDSIWRSHDVRYDQVKHVSNLDSIFHLLDGKGFSNTGDLYNAIHQCDGKFDSTYFSGRCFQNGNLHIKVKQLDLLDRFNEIGCGEGSVGLPNPPGGVQKGCPLDDEPPRSSGMDFFITPEPIVDIMIRVIDNHLGVKRDVSACGRWDNTSWRSRKVNAMEPSAGDGAIAYKMSERGCDNLYCIEFDNARCDELNKRRSSFSCENADFMKKDPFPAMDVIAMNPPWSNQRALFHVRHAERFLTYSGILVAIIPPSWKTNADKYATAFREWVATLDHEWIELPAGTFNESGTMVSSGILVIRREERVSPANIGSNQHAHSLLIH